MLSCAGGPPVSKVHFSRSWAPASPRRHWSRPHAAPARRVRCNRACQRERAKALPPCQQTARDAGLRCGDEMIRYSYVAASNSCVPFLYGGCRGSANNFPTFEQCRDTCKTEPEPPTTKVFGVSKLAKSRGACFRAPRRAGWPCRDAEVRYSFIHSTNSCVPFEFRGCGGSNNNFATFSECSNLCKAPPVQGVGPRRAARRCRLPWQAGPCRGFGPMMRYFYNDQKAACELALYSGCGGQHQSIRHAARMRKDVPARVIGSPEGEGKGM
ncbi:Papilin [Amphibalanus amphitrite]|uniref:Papilin n=1 Tax=Amphibalanus amphitrite TaxID=1232801 RepID=A0A6A4VH60_AMPAM|nr:Papilin [Amphibalanus amphitrite]